MNLGEILSGVGLTSPLAPEFARMEIEGLEYDSRRIAPGFAFFAFPGSKADGRRFASDRAHEGATARPCHGGAAIR